MAAIRGADTKPEMLVRRALHARGFRYRLHDRRLPGRPDLIFPRYRAVLFINGCFWHGHDCPLFVWPKSRSEFWRAKIGGNIDRDLRNEAELEARGWRVGVIWECALKGAGRRDPGDVIDNITGFLEGAENAFWLEGRGAGQWHDLAVRADGAPVGQPDLRRSTSA